MTSMPASLRARAMIFAPRSWPSRPGLATTTRILRLDSGSAAVSVVACIDSRDCPAAGLRSGAGRARRADSTGRAGLAGFDGGPPRQVAFGELPAQHLLVELSHARLGDGLDERELVGDPPLRDLAAEM